MKRRNYVKLLGLGPLLAAWPALAMAVPDRRSNPAGPAEAVIRRRLSGLVPDPELASVVGRAYLRAYPDRGEWRVLLADSGLAWPRKGMPGDARSIRHDLDSRRCRDFLDGNTVILDGWVLARSEVSLCALVAISIGTENA